MLRALGRQHGELDPEFRGYVPFADGPVAVDLYHGGLVEDLYCGFDGMFYLFFFYLFLLRVTFFGLPFSASSA